MYAADGTTKVCHIDGGQWVDASDFNALYLQLCQLKELVPAPLLEKLRLLADLQALRYTYLTVRTVGSDYRIRRAAAGTFVVNKLEYGYYGSGTFFLDTTQVINFFSSLSTQFSQDWRGTIDSHQI